jgi:itaconyl-CoA hydratase
MPNDSDPSISPQPTVKPGWSGRFYEDFTIGDVYRHPMGRTICETDNIWFTNLTLNTNQLHFNNHYSEGGIFGKPLVNSTFTVSLVTGMSVTDLTQNAQANLAWDQIRLPNPVFVGDTLYAESLVTDKRESSSRPTAGIVSVKTRGLNQDAVVVCTFTRTFLVAKHGHAPDRFPLTDAPW